jgi:Ca2+-binding EF-hand superfamily protein
MANEVRNPSQVQAGINRRNDGYIRDFFQRTAASYGTSTLTNEQFVSALDELGVFLNEDEIKIFFHTMDGNCDGVIDCEEFRRALLYPSNIEQLFSTLSISQIVSDAMPDGVGIYRLRALEFSQI